MGTLNSGADIARICAFLGWGSRWLFLCPYGAVAVMSLWGGGCWDAGTLRGVGGSGGSGGIGPPPWALGDTCGDPTPSGGALKGPQLVGGGSQGGQSESVEKRPIPARG